MNIFERELKAGLFRAGCKEHRLLVDKALKDIEKALSFREPSFVSLSWGKQSSCLMHLVRRVDSSVPGVFWKGTESEILSDYSQVSASFIKMFPIEYIEVLCAKDFKVNAKKWASENGYMLNFMGLCACESKARKYTCYKADSNNIFRYNDGRSRCCPLARWTDKDVAAYVAINDIPMLRQYRQFGFSQRTSARINFGANSGTERGLDQLSQRQLKDLADIKRGELDESTLL